jgi:hypothetical protein|tara:strand:+ start:20 stop:427 length:408 start_codon:yes stop_codon:yes gene_type:complete
MLLGASGDKAGLTVDLDVAIDPSKSGDAGVPSGEELLAFASAANRRSETLPQARAALKAVVGPEGLLEAAATVAIFNGLVRVADGTGIQLDPSMLTSTADTRATLGLDLFSGAANSEGAPTEPRQDGTGVMSMFS